VKYQSKLKTALSTNFYGGKKGMKNRIYSIMDSSKKKAGIAIVCCMLLLTMGTGMAFAASSSTSNGETSFDYKENLEPVYATDKDTAIRESNAKMFSVYEQYGLMYSKEPNRLYYNGELVRYFEDNQATDGTFSGTISSNVDGNIDIHAVRDSAGNLIGIELYNQEDFDARTISIQNKKGNDTAISAGTDNNSASVNP